VSSLAHAPLPADAVYFGEISLSGAVRPVAQASARLKEAKKLGFGRAVIPEAARSEGDSGLTLEGVSALSKLVADIAARGTRAQLSDNRPADED
jgi:DNA repair protein RadA/Sms